MLVFIINHFCGFFNSCSEFFAIFCRKKRLPEQAFFFCRNGYSLEPVSIKEPMMSFWKHPNRMMTGRTQTTEAAMTGP